MANVGAPDPERIRKLIGSGEAVDEQDAADALNEEVDAELFRSTDRLQHRERIDAALSNPETEPIDRWDLKFRKAVVETGATPDDLEFLWYQALLDDLRIGEPRDEAARRRRESAQRRLERKADALVRRLGVERAKELFERYRIRLQELFDEPEPKEGGRE